MNIYGDVRICCSCQMKADVVEKTKEAVKSVPKLATKRKTTAKKKSAKVKPRKTPAKKKEE